MGFYIDDAGEGGLRQWLHSSKPAPFPCTPTPRKRGMATTKQERTHCRGYIFILQDDYLKVTFLNCLTGGYPAESVIPGAAGAAPARSETPGLLPADQLLGCLRLRKRCASKT